MSTNDSVRLFEEQAEKAPDRVAVSNGDQQLSYAELNRRANRLACHLCELGCGPEARVGLYAERSPELIIGILGILKSGAAYVPLDPAYPRAMLDSILQDGGVRLLVVQREVRERLSCKEVQTIEIESETYPAVDPPPRCCDENLAYIIYTSGSSGRPKGVMITIANVARLLQVTHKIYDFGPRDVWTLFHSYAFDFSVWEIWGALAFGGRLVIVPYLVSRSPDAFVELLEREQVTVLNQTPSAFQQLQSFSPRNVLLRYVIFGGEALSGNDIQPWCESLAKTGTAMVNMYGITETTVHVTWYPIPGDIGKGNKIPIGEPLHDLKLHLFDEWMEEVQEGLAGELYVSGAGLARGYLNRPALTAERFVPDPFAAMPGARLYRSGDRARRRADGTLEYLGRCDEQIKLRGFRIEPGEIEAVIRKWAGVGQVSVLLTEDETGDKTLVAYIVANGTPPGVSKLKEFVAQYLPAHMIPSAFVFLERLPLTENGKLDRKALPVSDTGARADTESSARPGDGIEEIIAGIWEHLLKLSFVPVESNFFELGGHSLLATQVMSRVRDAMQVDLPLSALFENPTVRGLAFQVRHARKLPQSSRKQISKAHQENDFPLSFAQERLWFLDQLQPGTIAYNIPFALSLEGTLDISALRDAMAGLVHRHTALRTCFPVVSGVAKQRVLQSLPVSIPVVDLTGAHESLAQELSREEAQRPFHLKWGPLWRMALLRLSPVNHIVLLTMHHIACDGWSTSVLAAEFIELYAASREARQSRLSALDIEYVDFAGWQREWLGDEVLLRQLAYWKDQLKDASPLQLPTDQVRQRPPSFRGRACEFKVAPDVTEALRTLSRREGATLFMTLAAAFNILLARHANQWDISMGTDIANRNRVEIEKLVGFFVNTLVLRTRMDPQESFSQLLHKVRETTLAAYENQDVPFERVVEELAPKRDISYSPLFRVKLVLQNIPAWDQQNVDIAIRPWKRETRTAKFDLTMGIRENDGLLQADLEYATDLFDTPTIERLAGRFQRLLHSLIADPQRPICELPLLSEGEALQLASWNDTGAPIALRTLPELLAKQTGKRPDAIVAVSGNSLLSYAELNARANCYAESLRALGVGPEMPVGICVKRGLDLLIGSLGILKAGAAFVPLDPSYPASRLEFMVENACVPVILLHRDLGLSWAFASAVPIYMDDDAQMAEHGRTREASHASVRNLAYIIYTSGSTGKPKGVMVEHGGLCNVASAQAAAFHVGPDSHVLQFASASFDACVFELVLSACHGATLHFIAEETAMNPQAVLDTIEMRGITHAVLPPTMLSALPVATAPRSLSCVVAAGEALTRRAVENLGGVCRVVNAYGPTEATIWATAFGCGADPVQNLPIGKPIANCRVYILDAYGQQTPIGITGELYIGGIGVTRGYIQQPDLTADRFLPDPFAAEPGRRMYRTGDLGRWTSLGNLEFLGRNDFQVKIRGFRIELVEIESVLVKQPGVSHAAVVVHEFHTGEPRIVAYVVAGSPRTTAQQLKDALGEYLPDYMMPTTIIFLQELPLTPNAKIDRQALAALQIEMPSSQSCAEPANEIESAIATVWSDVLQVPSIGRDDNFFDLGGQSFLAVKAVAKLREMLQIEVVVHNIFDYPMLSDLAGLLKAVVREKLPPIVPAGRTQKLPLSFAQERLWFLAQVPGASQAYHISFGLDLEGELDRPALSRALDRLVARHEVLRTRFDYSDGQAWQRIAPERDSQFALVEFDLRNSADLSEELNGLIQREAQMPFDLAAGALIRGALILLQDGHYALLITMHHIISDGWSRDILRNEITSLYEAFYRNEPDPLPPLPLQYADYALWQRQWMEGAVFQEQASYWERELAGAPAILHVPADHGRPAQQDYAGGFVPLVLTQELTSELRKLGRRHGMTLYMVVLAGWAALLSRLSCQQDLIIGTPVANRDRSEIQGLIGFFVNLLPIRLDFSGSPDVTESLARVKTRVLEAQQHQDIPFERMVDILQPPRSLAHSPIFQVAFSWQDSDGAPISLPLVDVKLLPAAIHRTAKFDLTLSLQESDGRIRGGIEYASSLFEGPTVERYCGYLLELLEGMVKQEQTAMDELPLLGEDEWRQVVYGWNQTRAEYPATMCVQELFEEQAGRSPHAVALVYEETRLSYAELNRRANQLAHYLRRVGVGPDTRVGICAERSLELVMALLAVLKAGGAYVPLDPGYPYERLSYMLLDSAPVVVLMQKHLRGLFSGRERRVPMIDLEQDAAAWSSQPEINLDTRRLGLRARHLAYVIYTSGSTGQPKGVAVEHGGVANRLDWMQRRYGLTEQDGVLQKTPFSFDVSVWEFFWPLLNGSRLVLARPEGHKDAEYLTKTIWRERITTVHFVPSMLQAFLNQAREGEAGATLKRVICSGEALPWGLARQFQKQMPGVELHNLYGPTEATVDVTAWSCGEGAEENGIPIGRPIANTQIYVLNGKGQPVPVGVAGELYIGGVGVARGYLKHAELTAERFVPDGFSETVGGRLYRTGDLARWRGDGAIEYMGRCDFQVKIRGFRIELEEIEARLRECAGIREALVIAQEDEAGEKRLVAYYTVRGCKDGGDEHPQTRKAASFADEQLAVEERAASDGQKTAGAQESWTERLRAHLSARLPDYMVPVAFVRLERLPLTANGKLDRKALPAPDTNAYATKRYEAPRGEVEKILASIWAGVLKRERVGRHDNFFELGGHSLLAIRTIEAMRRHGLAIDVRDIFAAHSLADLAATIGAGSPIVETPPNLIPDAPSVITPVMLTMVRLTTEEIDRIVSTVPGGAQNVQDIYPLAPLQQGVLFHHLMGEQADPYVLGTLLSFDSRDRLDAYLRALQFVINRHDILRTSVVWERVPEPVQIVWRNATLKVEDVARQDLPVGTTVAERFYNHFTPRLYHMDLRQAPLLSVHTVYDDAEQRWLVMQMLHQFVGDHSTLATMQKEIEGFLRGEVDVLPTPVPFRSLIAQARFGITEEEHLAYFRGLLGDVDEPTIPFGLADVQGDGVEVKDAIRPMDASLSQRLVQLAQKLGVSRASICHVVWAHVLALISARNDVVFGTVVSGRMHGGVGADRAMGPFINTLPFRIVLGSESAEACIRNTHSRLVELVRHEHVSLALAQRCSALPANTPLFSALLNYRHSGEVFERRSYEAESVWHGIQLIRGEERTNYPLSLSIDDMGNTFALTVQVNGPVSPDRICELTHTALAQWVNTLYFKPATPVSAIDILPVLERQQVVDSGNATKIPYAKDACVQQLFEEQARLRPETIAVVAEDRTITYGELNRRANRLSHHLRDLGIHPDDRVVLCARRGIEIVTGLLAILKAGGAYVPIDPTHPRERIEYYIKDSVPSALLTEEAISAHLPTDGLPLVHLDHMEALLTHCPDNDLEPDLVGLSANHLAYVIYTSGSTGAPKGAEVAHRSLVNFLQSMQQNPGLTANDRLLAVTTVSFDIAGLELLLPLISGGRLTIARTDDTVDGLRLREMLRKHEITVLQATPVTWRILLETGWTPTPDLKMLCGGEALPPDLAGALLRRQETVFSSDSCKRPTPRPLDFSLFFFAATSDDSRHQAYQLLHEAAQFGDQNGFSAVWIPERHFHPFGGIYPNPSVIGASLAAVTRTIKIRAGSVVLPLHDPIRVAEEWATLDNLSGGRVGLSFASGWNANDFVLAPGKFENRREDTLLEIETVRSLWRGDTVTRKNGANNDVAIRIFPKPVQTELPMWLTSGGTLETFRSAGRIGAGILTHLLGQDLDKLAEKIEVYRSAYREARHPGSGHVTLMLHTFVASTMEEAEKYVRDPFSRYLEQSLDLTKVMAHGVGLPTSLPEKWTEKDRAALLSHAFERYFAVSGLMGDENTCFAMLERIAAIDVDEIACLIDFGVEFEATKASLSRLAALRNRWAQANVASLQEASSKLAVEARNVLFNMYGPTETTVWSATTRVEPDAVVGAGKPIANTQLYVLDPQLRPLPLQAEGELYIGGAGVARGYHKRPALTAERFVPDPFSSEPGARMYKTGDLARWSPGGYVEYGGRNDFQLKIRGHRIEPGEIEAALLSDARINQAMVVAQGDAAQRRLVAYITERPGGNQPAEAQAATAQNRTIGSELQRHLRHMLPEYMVPSAIVVLDSFPTTRNGKIDRLALPKPETPVSAKPRLPRTAREELLCGVFAEVLRVQNIGIDDNFFELGGHSLFAIQLISRLRQALGWDVTVRMLFESPTVATLAAEIDRQSVILQETLSQIESLSEQEAQLRVRAHQI